MDERRKTFLEQKRLFILIEFNNPKSYGNQVGYHMKCRHSPPKKEKFIHIVIWNAIETKHGRRTHARTHAYTHKRQSIARRRLTNKITKSNDWMCDRTCYTLSIEERKIAIQNETTAKQCVDEGIKYFAGKPQQKYPKKKFMRPFHCALHCSAVCCVLFSYVLYVLCFQCVSRVSNPFVLFSRVDFWNKNNPCRDAELFSCYGMLWNAVWRVLCCSSVWQPTIRFPFSFTSHESPFSEVAIIYNVATHTRARPQEDYWKLFESLELNFSNRSEWNICSKTKMLGSNCNRVWKKLLLSMT